MPLTSIYNAVKHHPAKVRTIQEVMQQNPEKRNMFVNSDIVAGKNFTSSVTVRSSSTSVNAIASELKTVNQTVFAPLEERQWQNCKSLKEKSGTHFCQKFQMKCVKDKCPKKFIDI